MNPYRELAKKVINESKDDDLPEFQRGTWRSLFPEAAAQVWTEPDPLVFDGHRADGAECYTNGPYYITVRHFDVDPVFGSNGGMVQIGINRNDGTATHDWRDFQWIKNAICGPEVEAFELYPAESRLLDPSNYWILWAFPRLKQIKVGKQIRSVEPPERAIAPQRGFAPIAAEPPAASPSVATPVEEPNT